MTNQTIYIGDDSIDNLQEIVKLFNPKRIFIFRGKQSYDTCGAKCAFENIIPAIEGCQVIYFSDFSENPKIEDVERGVKLLETSNADIIIAIGGGSVIDMSKLVRFFYSYSGDKIGNKFNQERALLPLITLPTTAGTGCEVTKFAVMYKGGIKYSVAHEDIMPDYAIVYPPFTYNNPKYLTACTGFDALAQAIEAYWNVNSTKESDDYAIKAIEILWKNLPIAVNNPTTESRDEVSIGSCLAGKAINITKTTAPHAFSYPFTSIYGYPHGHAVAMTFPYFWNINVISQENLSDKLNATIYAKKIKHLVEVTGTDIIHFIESLGLALALPPNFDREAIIDKVNINRLQNNPVIISPIYIDNILIR